MVDPSVSSIFQPKVIYLRNFSSIDDLKEKGAQKTKILILKSSFKRCKKISLPTTQSRTAFVSARLGLNGEIGNHELFVLAGSRSRAFCFAPETKIPNTTRKWTILGILQKTHKSRKYRFLLVLWIVVGIGFRRCCFYYCSKKGLVSRPSTRLRKTVLGRGPG